MDSQKYDQGRARSRSRGREKMYRNPYLNFLRDFRKSCDSMDPKEVMIRAGKVWKGLPPGEKQRYIDEASRAARDSLPAKKTSPKESKEFQGKVNSGKNSNKSSKRQSDEESDGASISSYDSDY